MPPKKQMGRAEKMFREAFDRLKRNKPQRLPEGTPVTQNNVAKEAGVDPSALRSARYPELSAEIKKWARERPADGPISARQATLAKRAENRKWRERVAGLTAQRDEALSRLVDAEAEIVELMQRVVTLEAQLRKDSNVTPHRRDNEPQLLARGAPAESQVRLRPRTGRRAAD